MRIGSRRSRPEPGAGRAATAACETGDVQARFGDAMRLIADLREQLFELQEQNQQLRRDLAAGVCPRLCSRPYRGAS